MSTWKPLTALVATVALLTVLMIYGTDAQGFPNSLGWGLLAVFAAGALLTFR